MTEEPNFAGLPDKAIRAAIVGMISQERDRQVDAEGWSAEHDDQHWDCDLLKAAMCYIWSSRMHDMAPGEAMPLWTPTDPCGERGSQEWPVPAWPWEGKWWKPKSSRRDLIRAAALIIAHLERAERHKSLST